MEGRRSRSSAKGVSRLPKNEGDKPEPWKAVKNGLPAVFFRRVSYETRVILLLSKERRPWRFV